MSFLTSAGPQVSRRILLRALLAAPAAVVTGAAAVQPATVDTLLARIAQHGGIGVPTRAVAVPAAWHTLVDRAVENGLLLICDADGGEVAEDEYTLSRAGFAAIGRKVPGGRFDDEGRCCACQQHISDPHAERCPYEDAVLMDDDEYAATFES
ncbi:hypothetical protein [Catellatospora sp. NPDC049133]|uniref:hypothetical protein n=1 Tax=Catellatospora sp. NPDC049133 TaxID=3155499 RepID=UPI0033CC6005